MVVEAETQFDTQLAILDILNIHIIKEMQFETQLVHNKHIHIKKLITM